jgi:hypothetical protein
MDGSKSASFTKQSAFETVRNTIFVKKNRGSHVAIPVVEHIEPGSSKDSVIGFCRANNYPTVSRFESVPSAARSNSVPVFLG